MGAQFQPGAYASSTKSHYESGYTIRFKLFGIGGVILLAMGSIMYILASTNSKSVEALNLVEERNAQLSLASEVRYKTLELNTVAMDIIVDKDSGQVSQERKDLIIKNIAFINQSVSRLEELADTEEEKADARFYRANFPKVANDIQVTLVGMVENRAPREEFEKLDDILDGEMGNLEEKMESIVASVSNEVSEALKENEDTLNRASQIGFAVFAGAMAFLLGTFTIFARGLLSNINGVIAMIRDIAEGEGDLTRRLDTKSKDEIGELAFWFNRFVGNLQELMVKIGENSKSLATASEEMSSVSSQLAGGSEEMSSQTTTVAGATEQMSANINAMAAAVEEMSMNVGSISTGAEQMSQNMNMVSSAVEEMSTSIQEISKSAREASTIADNAGKMSQEASTTMSALDAASVEIGKVTEVIKRIAEQTNLLALNATIEAASAGEAGKGFAVVANEIKELANQSAGAAEDIASRIEGTQENTRKAVKVIAEVAKVIGEINASVETINASVEQQTRAAANISSNVGDAAGGANNIASSISEVAKGANSVSQNAGEAAKGANNVSSNIQGVNKAVNDQSAGAQQVNTSSKQLAEIAGELDGLIKRFKVA
ncbi:MAG: methyl-accepting chemotaxis protein [Nitrospinota bacterium]|nr:methyl-accepting chemotaxis protein [Nitrospinota bacterium]